MTSNISIWDILIVAVYFVAVLSLGVWKGRGERGTEDFVVGGRRVPWFAVLCSIVATEISAATFIGVPAVGFDGNLAYLQFSIGSLIARFAVAYIFISAFYALGVMTVYEFLFMRFGSRSRYTATAFFLVGRVLAAGVRLYIATFALAGIFDIPMWQSLILFTSAALVYTWVGGISSVIWTDVIQGFVFVAGGLVLVGFLQYSVGWGEIFSFAAREGKLDLFHFTSSTSGSWGWLNDPVLFYVALINGFLSTTASLGTDQDLTQRMLTCDNAAKARRSVILSGFIGIPVAALFLLVGVGLYVYYTQVYAGVPLPWAESGDTRLVLPHFISQVLPSGLKGLLIAALFATAMSSVDSALGALSSTSVVDLYKPLIRPGMSERHYLRACRVSVPIFAALICVVAWAMREHQDMLWLALKVTAIPSGALLGVFLLGLVSQRAGTDKGCMIAMISSAIYSTIMLWLITAGLHPLAWSWVIVLGTIWTLAVGLLFVRKRA
ncbi:MAG: sodium/solute symporter [Opitutales bacterium]|nr:sodium/solute symporter [Opitutales bacterium]